MKTTNQHVVNRLYYKYSVYTINNAIIIIQVTFKTEEIFINLRKFSKITNEDIV